MSRRGRAIVFGLLALVAAAAAAMVADGYGSSIARGFGPLRPAVVAGQALPAGKALEPDAVERYLEVRRIPVRFVPPGTLASPQSALGLEPQADVPTGSYVLAQQLSPPQPKHRASDGLSRGRQPVEIAVSGADALAAGGAAGGLVDVVVTTEPQGAGPGRTYVAAQGVPLLGISAGPDGPGPDGTSSATLGLFRSQALRLIAAQNFARQVTLLPGASGRPAP